MLATQNPIEQEGTYPLPEAQLDRFLFQIDVRYPSQHEEIDIVKRTTAPLPTTIVPVLSAQDIVGFQGLVPRVPAADHVVQHAVAVVRASRPDARDASDLVRKNVAFGAGPRASQGLILGAKARAILHGRYAAEIEDVRALIEPILKHRLVMNFRAEAEGVTASPRDRRHQAKHRAVTHVLEPELAVRLAGLTLRAKRTVDGLLAGMHRSPHRGASAIFKEHRAYRPGDDPRLIDWRAYARSDRYTIKHFEHETQLRGTLALDISQIDALGQRRRQQARPRRNSSCSPRLRADPARRRRLPHHLR